MKSDRNAQQLIDQHWRDLALHSFRDQRPYFTNFLPQEDQAAAQKIAASAGVTCLAWGGVENAACVMLCFTPETVPVLLEQFPIACLTFTYRASLRPEHCDFLGTLMACNVECDRIGDILIAPHMAQMFVCRHVASVVMQEVCRVGRVGVSVSDDAPVSLTAQTTFTALCGTVASLRADAIAAFVTRLSREKAAQLIRQGRLMRCHTMVEAPSALMQVGDVFSIRGYGKFRIDALDGVTRKWRYHITIQKYQ